MTVDETPLATRPAADAAPVVSILTDEVGQIATTEGTWLGGPAPAGQTVFDLVHPDDHEALEHVMSWLLSGGSSDYGLSVHVRGAYGWDPASLVAASTSDGFSFALQPALPDPGPSMLELMAEGRELAAVLDEALATFADLDATMWATVHYGDVDGRFTEVVTTTGMDTFRRAVEAAVSGDDPCPWDLEVSDDEIDATLEVTALPDGVHLAARHASLHACRVVSIASDADVDAARLVVWAESSGLLESPTMFAMLERVVALVTHAFQFQGARDALSDARQRDGLTGLLNRQAFFKTLTAAKARRQCAVAVIDVDKFRAVNEWKGHLAGDELLAEIGRRLNDAMRPGDVVARIAGNEFAMLLADIKSADAAQAIASRIGQIFDRQFVLGGTEFTIAATTGVAVAAPERSGMQLFDAAQRTMVATKAEQPGTSRLA